MKHFIPTSSFDEKKPEFIKGCLYFDFDFNCPFDDGCFIDITGCEQQDNNENNDDDRFCMIDYCSYRDLDNDECIFVDYCSIDVSGEGCFMDVCYERDTDNDMDNANCIVDECGIDHGCQDNMDWGFCINDVGCQGHDQALDFTNCPTDYQ